MAEAKKLYLEDPAPILDEEDEETLAAIDEGIRDADERSNRPNRRSPQADARVDYRLVFTKRVLSDLNQVIGRIADVDHDIDEAFHFGSALLDHVDLLTRFPRMAPVIRTAPESANWCIVPSWFTIESTTPKQLVEILHSGTQRGGRQVSLDVPAKNTTSSKTRYDRRHDDGAHDRGRGGA